MKNELLPYIYMPRKKALIHRTTTTQHEPTFLTIKKEEKKTKEKEKEEKTFTSLDFSGPSWRPKYTLISCFTSEDKIERENRLYLKGIIILLWLRRVKKKRKAHPRLVHSYQILMTNLILFTKQCVTRCISCSLIYPGKRTGRYK